MLKTSTIPAKTLSRFWDKVDKDPFIPGGCWLWVASKNTHGYGQFMATVSKVHANVLAHRISYEVLVDSIPSGLHIDHLCRVRSCVNPDHMEPVTCLENIRRGLGGAHNRDKTECRNGHPYDDGNTYVRSNGYRDCRICIRASRRRFRLQPPS